jgi:hypothetical protein|tara:strand:+ start:745 stop:894 length:150 start_codon:yes stop_codon:yes gene_type:complete
VEYVIHIKGKGGKCFAYHSTREKSELDRLVKKYLAMKGITVEVKQRELT